MYLLQPRVLFVNRYPFVSTAKKLASSINNACRFQQSNNLQYSCCGKRFLSAVDSSTINNEESSSNDDNNIPPRLSVAIVGAGPSGFYSAKYLTSSILKQIQSTVSNSAAEQSIADKEHTSLWSGVDIDMIERLPTPYGLVRYGVAPDHPEVKNVENDFASLFNKKVGGDDTVSSDASISYFGNIDVGKDISITKLQSLYDVVVLAYGCQADNRLGIPGEELEGILSAREFVAWYNGHPEFGHIGSIVKQCLWPSSKENTNESSSKEDNTTAKVSPSKVVVIGQGNVALDVARVLAKGKDGLIDTDTPSSVLEILQGGVSHVSIVGRRGHVQGAFTIKELRELTKLKKEGHDTSFIVRKEELDLGMTESSKAEFKGASGRPKTRIDKLLQDSAITEEGKGDMAKQVELRFLMNPISLEPNDKDPKRVGKVVCKRTKLEGEPFQQRPMQTDETETLDADLVLVSIGYKGIPLEGTKEELFDNQKNTVANEHGKVAGDNNLFVSGWIKRGPSGIIGTNIGDAKDTVASIMQFINTKQDVTSQNKKGRAGLTDLLQNQDGVDAISWDKFQKIEEAETNSIRLRSDAQPREKILSIEEMIKVSS